MLKTFRIGGIHPPGNKLSAGCAIREIPVPEQVVLPLSQHIGVPARAIVSKGDRVKVGTRIGEATGAVSAHIHASVSGTVTGIEERVDASGYKHPAIVIQTDGDDWEEQIDRSDTLKKECTLEAGQIRERIAQAGVVGLGGATFPTAVKLTLPQETKADTLIINAVECEPYLTADHALMLRYPEEILTGITLAMKAMGVARAVIGIENNKPDAIERLKQHSATYPGIGICPLRVKYPQGGEKQLVDAILKKQVKSGKLPLSVGAVVLNVGSAFAVYEAVQKNKPLIDRIVTVTGPALPEPANIRARLGTTIRQLIDACGGVPDNTGKLICGGPMMGKSLVSADLPVTKGCSGIILIPEQDAARKVPANCIRCAKCVFACPMGLTPSLLMLLSENREWDEAEKEHITDCMECGCCSYSCPANRPILDQVKLGKKEVTDRLRRKRENNTSPKK